MKFNTLLYSIPLALSSMSIFAPIIDQQPTAGRPAIGTCDDGQCCPEGCPSCTDVAIDLVSVGTIRGCITDSMREDRKFRYWSCALGKSCGLLQIQILGLYCNFCGFTEKYPSEDLKDSDEAKRLMSTKK